MRLYFLRHGEAVDQANSDFERILTGRGLARTERATRVISQLFKPDIIYSSPRVRARQTAEIVAKALQMSIEIREEVDYSFDVDAARHLIRDAEPGENILFVGHNPSMSEVVEALTGAHVALRKGGLARVDVTTLKPLKGELVWLITPKVFDALDQK